WHSLGYELTRPGTRRGMFLEMGMAMLADLLEAFVALVVASWIPLLLWRPGLILELVMSPMYPVIGVTSLLMAGIVIHVLRYRMVAVALRGCPLSPALSPSTGRGNPHPCPLPESCNITHL